MIPDHLQQQQPRTRNSHRSVGTTTVRHKRNNPDKRNSADTQTKSPKAQKESRSIQSRIVSDALQVALGNDDSEFEHCPEFADFPTAEESNGFRLRPSRRDSDRIFDGQKLSRTDSGRTAETVKKSLESFESPQFQKRFVTLPGKNENGKHTSWPLVRDLESPTTNPRLVLSSSTHARKIRTQPSPALRRRSLRAGKMESPNPCESPSQHITDAQATHWGIGPNVPFPLSLEDVGHRSKDRLSNSMHSRKSRSQSIGRRRRSSSQSSHRRRNSLSSRANGDSASPSRIVDSSFRKEYLIHAPISPDEKGRSNGSRHKIYHGKNGKDQDRSNNKMKAVIVSKSDQPQQHEKTPSKPKRRASMNEHLQIAGNRNRQKQASRLDTAWGETRSERRARSSLLSPSSVAWKESNSERQTRSSVMPLSSGPTIHSRFSDPGVGLPAASKMLNKQPTRKWISSGEATPLKCADSPNRVTSIPVLARLSNQERIRRSEASSARRGNVFDSLDKVNDAATGSDAKGLPHSKDKTTDGLSGDRWNPDNGKSASLNVELVDCLEW